MKREWILLLVVYLGGPGCTRAPTTEQICAHYQALDDAAPMLRAGSAPAHPSNKVASCTRQLDNLNKTDPMLYNAVSKCVMGASSSDEAWTCWIGSHVSPQDSAGTAKYVACTGACSQAFSKCQTTCIDGKMEMLGTCSTACVDTDDQCATACAFP